MESDDREQRLRSNIGFTIVWTAFAIGVFGLLLGDLLVGACTAAGFFYGFSVSESAVASMKIAGPIIVGFFVLLSIVKSYVGAPRER